MKRLIYVLGLGLAAAASAGVYDECVFHFEGGRDGFTGMAPDGIAQKGEIVDELRGGVASHANHGATVSGMPGQVAFTPESVPFFPSGLGDQTVSCLDLSYTLDESTGEKRCAYGTVELPFLADACPTNVYSAVLRLKRKQANPYRQNQWFISFGYSRNSNGQGFLLGFNSAGTLATHCTGSTSPGNLTGLQNVPFDQWVDIGVVVRGNVVTYYQAFPGLDRTSGQGGPSQIRSTSQTFIKDGYVPNTTMDRANIRIGGQIQGQSALKVFTDANYQKFFTGSFQRIAFWNRALELHEIAEAFAFPRPNLLQLGAANGHGDEFSAEETATDAIAAGMVQSAPWSGFSGTLRAGDARTITFNAKADDAQLAQLLRIAVASGSGQLKATLNGAVLASGRPVAPDAPLTLVMPVRKTPWLKAGANTLVLERVDGGAASLVLDAVRLGGSWTVGTQDNIKKQDFGWHQVTAPFAYFDTYAFPRALNNKSGAKNFHLTVEVPEGVSARSPARFGMRWRLDTPTPDATLAILVDGVEKVERPIPTGYENVWVDLGPGVHDVHFNSRGTEGVSYFDCFWLTFDPPPTGTMLLLR